MRLARSVCTAVLHVCTVYGTRNYGPFVRGDDTVARMGSAARSRAGVQVPIHGFPADLDP